MSHMTHFYVLLLALGIGVIAGLRSLTAPAVISWAAVSALDQSEWNLGFLGWQSG